MTLTPEPSATPAPSLQRRHGRGHDPRPDQGGCPVHNRLEAVLVHVNWYLLAPVARLARDAGVSHSALSRVLSGRAAPSFALAWRIAHALEGRLGPALPGGRLDPGEVFSLDGTYPTASACALVGCPGCTLAQTPRPRRRPGRSL